MAKTVFVAHLVAILLFACFDVSGFGRIEPTRVGVDVAGLRKGAQDVSPEAVFGGTYDKLRPEQRKLVDDWFHRYNIRIHKNISPDSGYDSVPVSVRTTFEAITHALVTTPLTIQNGDRIGTALDLVQAVETVKGRSPGTRGDAQFRMYVTLKPLALKKLDTSREFTRTGDNSVFHIGYPINYRQNGGFPSIQVSVSRNGARADIDVDYRRSGFPAALFNGHLTAANSDVRAGGNYKGHTKRWDGLANWWRNLFGLSVERESGFVPEPEHDIAKQPRLTAKARLDDVVQDYLSTWLVLGKPNLAVAYVSARDYACVESSENERNPGDVVPRKLWNDLEEVNFLLGKPARLSDAVVRVGLKNDALVPIRNKYAAEFDLLKVPDDVAAEFMCSANSPASPPLRRYGTYYGSTFRIKMSGDPGSGSLLLLWRKEQGYWKIVSQQIDPGRAASDYVPDTAPSPLQPKPSPIATNVDPEMTRTVNRFFDELFVRKNHDAAFQLIAPSSFACLDDASLSGKRSSGRSASTAESFREELRQVAENSPASHNLEHIIERFDPENPTLAIVHHQNEHAYLLAGVPGDEARSFLCRQAEDKTGKRQYSGLGGPYFGAFFKIIEAGDEPAGLGLLWAKGNDGWKIVAIRMDEP